MSDPNTNDPDLAVSVSPPAEPTVNPPEAQPIDPNVIALSLDEFTALIALLDHVDTQLAADDIAARSPAVMKCRALFKPLSAFWKPARERN